ncbi:conserved hypothetical protein [Vibrio phage 468E53-1]|nr:conserved hypothetical protein [Vibrio phage 468E53-1]CAH9015990.1 conserved hypothetical protein [Vibrio phage 177E37-1]
MQSHSHAISYYTFAIVGHVSSSPTGHGATQSTIQVRTIAVLHRLNTKEACSVLISYDVLSCC